MPSIRTILLASVLLPLGACSGFLDQVQSTSDDLAVFAEDSGIVPPSDDGLEAVYQEGVSQHQEGDDEAAAASFLRAAEGGHAPAAYALALAYREGRGVPRNLAASSRWMTKAADLGDARAQFVLGSAYFNGPEAERDDEAATHWLGEAATQGHAGAQFLLGEAFANGRGVPADMAWAARWYGKAAHQGHQEAQFTYGLILATGNGLPQSRRVGYGWLKLAADGGHAKAKEAQLSLLGALSASERAAGEAWAADFAAGPNETFADQPTVMYVQHRLNGLGFKTGTVDGVVGPRTRTGIAAFQQAQGLGGDGQVTPDLLIALLQAPPG